MEKNGTITEHPVVAQAREAFLQGQKGEWPERLIEMVNESKKDKEGAGAAALLLGEYYANAFRLLPGRDENRVKYYLQVAGDCGRQHDANLLYVREITVEGLRGKNMLPSELYLISKKMAKSLLPGVRAGHRATLEYLVSPEAERTFLLGAPGSAGKKSCWGIRYFALRQLCESEEGFRKAEMSDCAVQLLNECLAGQNLDKSLRDAQRDECEIALEASQPKSEQQRLKVFLSKLRGEEKRAMREENSIVQPLLKTLLILGIPLLAGHFIERIISHNDGLCIIFSLIFLAIFAGANMIVRVEMYQEVGNRPMGTIRKLLVFFLSVLLVAAWVVGVFSGRAWIETGFILTELLEIDYCTVGQRYWPVLPIWLALICVRKVPVKRGSV